MGKKCEDASLAILLKISEYCIVYCDRTQTETFKMYKINKIVVIRNSFIAREHMNF